jgi:hypothetical protein
VAQLAVEAVNNCENWPPERSIEIKYSVALETAFQVKIGVIVVTVPEGEIRVVGPGGERIVKD